MIVRNKVIYALLIVGIVLDLAISALLAAAVVRADHASSQAKAAASSAAIARVAIYESCLNGNQYRADDLARWQQVLNLIDTMPQNQALQQFVAGVNRANAVTDKPKVCVDP